VPWATHARVDRNTDGVEANDLRGAVNFVVRFGLIRANGFARTTGEIAVARDRNSIELDGVRGESTIDDIDLRKKSPRDRHDSTNKNCGIRDNRFPTGMDILCADAAFVC